MSYYLLRVCDRCHDAMLMHHATPKDTYRENEGEYVLCDKCAKAFTDFSNDLNEESRRKRIEFLKGMRV